MKIAPAGAGRMDHLHGDEDDAPELTASEQAQADARADELMQDKLRDRDAFDDLIAGIEPSITNHPLHRALMSLDNACAGDRIALDAIRSALSQIQAIVVAEAEKVWRQELIEQAESELLEQVTA